jgi:hypothetical protein
MTKGVNSLCVTVLIILSFRIVLIRFLRRTLCAAYCTPRAKLRYE